jgi:tol-pal system protein YbgF
MMNARIFLLLCACNTACAELPPVVGQDGSVAPNPEVNIAKPSTPLSTTYDMMKRMEQLQGEVQQLTGKVEEQAFQIEELKKQQKTMYTDFDDRLQGIENKSGASGQSPAENAPADSGAVPPTSSSAGQQAAPSPAEGKPSDAAGSMSAAPATVPAASESPAQVSDAEKQEYQQAYDALRNGKTTEAITQFNAYLVAHPQGGYASNAQYWLGEAHRVNQDNESAKKAFNDVITTHPESAKVPDALLKLGYIEMEEKNSAKAREYLSRVTTEFPASKAAKLAEKKLLTLDTKTP